MVTSLPGSPTRSRVMSGATAASDGAAPPAAALSASEARAARARPACAVRGKTMRPTSIRSAAVYQAAGDFHHMLALIAAHFQLERCWHAQLAARTRHAARTVGRTARHLAHRGEILECIGESHDDHAVMQQGAVEGGDRGLLAAVLARGAAEHAPDLAHQRSARPEVAGLVEEIAHLRRHIAKARRRAEDDCIVLLELIRGSERGGLIELEAGRLGHFQRT